MQRRCDLTVYGFNFDIELVCKTCDEQWSTHSEFR